MIKKIFVAIAILLTTLSTVAFLSSQPLSATSYMGRSSEDDGGCPSFLGLTTWDCNVEMHDEDSIKSGIWTIAANILTDITVIAAYLVLGYVIYGGYLYIMSSGEPAKIAAGKKTLVHAFIGLAIVMLAHIIVNSIRIALGADFSADCVRGQCGNNPTDMVTSAVQWVIAIAGIVSVIFIVYGGVGYITSSGDPNKLQKAKQSILYACFGLIIVALAEIITAFISNIILKAAFITPYTTLANNNDIVISKEVHDKTIN